MTNDYTIPGYLALTASGGMPRYRICPFEVPTEEVIREVWVDFGPKGLTAASCEQLVEWLRTRPEIQIRLSDADRTRGFKLDLSSVAIFSFAPALNIALDTLGTVRPFVSSLALRELRFSGTNKIRDWELLSEAPSLQAVSLHHLKISDAAFLCSISNLRDLRLDAMATLESLEFLSGCHSLERLDLGFFEIPIPSLMRLQHLRQLSFCPRSQQDLWAVAQAPGLKEIRIDGPDGELANVEVYECFRVHPSLRRVHVTGIGWRRLRDALCERLGLAPTITKCD